MLYNRHRWRPYESDKTKPSSRVALIFFHLKAKQHLYAPVKCFENKQGPHDFFSTDIFIELEVEGYQAMCYLKNLLNFKKKHLFLDFEMLWGESKLVV